MKITLGQGALYGHMLTTYTRFNPVMGNDEEMPRIDKIQGSPEFIDLIYRVAEIDMDAAEYMCVPHEGINESRSASFLHSWCIWSDTPQGDDYWRRISNKLLGEDMSDGHREVHDLLEERLSELEDRFDSLIDTQQKREDSTGSSDRLMTFAEALAAMQGGSAVTRRVWHGHMNIRHGMFLDEEGNTAAVSYEDVIATDWYIVKD